MVLNLSRRAFLTGSAGAAVGCALDDRALAQTLGAAGDGFRILRANPRVTGPRSQGQRETPTWGYEGFVPGPLLRIKQGEELKVRLINKLPAGTAIHWHGIRVPNSMDGVPALTQPIVASAASFDYRFRTPDAGTFWYHAARIGDAERGLFGILVVDEAAAVDVDRDIIFVLDDWLLHADDIATKTNERLRFRLINAAKARVMRLRFDRHSVRVMAVDGQPAEPFLANNGRVTLGPGNRVDLFVEAMLEPGETASIFRDDAGTEKEISRLVYDRGEKRRASPLPEPPPLPVNPLPERIDMRTALRIEAPLDAGERSVWTSSAAGEFGSPLFSVKRGRSVVLAFPNLTDAAHAVHIHGHHARLLDNLDDGWKPFWLDTVMAGPRQTTRIAFVADNPGKWMIDNQQLADGEIGHAAWFEVN
jgi:FtsP/CotA-like multicopper oxidase with cupredoxin domain